MSSQGAASEIYALQEHSLTFGGAQGPGFGFAIEPWGVVEAGTSRAASCSHFVRTAAELHASASALTHLACSSIESPDSSAETHRHLLVAVQVLSGLAHALSAEAAHRMQLRDDAQPAAAAAGSRPAARADRQAVVDAPAFADHREAIQFLVNLHGSPNAAAKACGIDRETVRRLLSKGLVCKPETISKVMKVAAEAKAASS